MRILIPALTAARALMEAQRFRGLRRHSCRCSANAWSTMVASGVMNSGSGRRSTRIHLRPETARHSKAALDACDLQDG